MGTLHGNIKRKICTTEKRKEGMTDMGKHYGRNAAIVLILSLILAGFYVHQGRQNQQPETASGQVQILAGTNR